MARLTRTDKSFSYRPENAVAHLRDEDIRALRRWLDDGTVTPEYVLSVLGSPSQSFKVDPPGKPPGSFQLKLKDLGTLDDGWDSYGGKAPTREALDAARAVMRALLTAGIPPERLEPFAVAPMSDGGIQLEWHAHGGAVEIECQPFGTLGYLLEMGAGPDGAVLVWGEVAEV